MTARLDLAVLQRIRCLLNVGGDSDALFLSWRNVMTTFLLLSWVALIVVSYQASIIILKKTDLL